ncbi:hypothetical protein ANO11243_026220 [Dothideomycetidae sp. 11243]|nr:hypothetical protein ANO11243_026220 [fungal sp. No.11243]
MKLVSGAALSLRGDMSSQSVTGHRLLKKIVREQPCNARGVSCTDAVVMVSKVGWKVRRGVLSFRGGSTSTALFQVACGRAFALWEARNTAVGGGVRALPDHHHYRVILSLLLF